MLSVAVGGLGCVIMGIVSLFGRRFAYFDQLVVPQLSTPINQKFTLLVPKTGLSTVIWDHAVTAGLRTGLYGSNTRMIGRYG